MATKPTKRKGDFFETEQFQFEMLCHGRIRA